MGSILYINNLTYLYIAFLILGIATAGSCVGFTLIAEQFSSRYRSLSFGLNNGMVTLLSATLSPGISYILDIKEKIHKLNLLDYQQAFMIIFILLR